MEDIISSIFINLDLTSGKASNNPSNTTFVNSIIRCLISIDSFQAYFLSLNLSNLSSKIVLTFSKLLHSLSQSSTIIPMSSFIQAFSSQYPDIFLPKPSKLLNFLIMLLYELDQNLPDNIIPSLFQGKVLRKYNFSFYNYEETEEFKFLRFDVPNINEIDIPTLYSRYLTTTVYSSYNELYSNHGTLTSEIRVWPPVLIIYLNRYKYSKEMVKTAVAISENLDFPEGPSYRLVSLYSYIGNSDFGHYYSIVKKDSWVIYDGNHTEQVTFDRISTSRVCLLIYNKSMG
jgi:ubiquitin C-terminal hydrolase